MPRRKADTWRVVRYVGPSDFHATEVTVRGERIPIVARGREDIRLRADVIAALKKGEPGWWAEPKDLPRRVVVPRPEQPYVPDDTPPPPRVQEQPPMLPPLTLVYGDPASGIVQYVGAANPHSEQVNIAGYQNFVINAVPGEILTLPEDVCNYLVGAEPNWWTPAMSWSPPPAAAQTNYQAKVYATYQVTNQNGLVLGDPTSGGSFTATLTDATANVGQSITLKNVGSANTVTVAAAAGQTIDGASSLALSAGQWVTVESDGTTTWRLVSSTATNLGPSYALDAFGNIGIGTTLGSLVPGSGSANANTVIGQGAGAHLTTGPGNVLIGQDAADLMTTSANNVVIGANAGIAITVGGSHVIIGQQAGQATGTTTGDTDCIAIGYQALQSYTGSSTIAIGSQALQFATGTGHVAIGFGAGAGLTTASNCTMLGYKAGYNTVTGGNMTAIGSQALIVSTGQHETAVGSFALGQQTTGNDNCVIGYSAGWNVIAGTQNTFVGSLADNSATAVDTTGATGVGYNVGHQANYTTTLGSGCSATAAGAIAIGVDHTGAAASSGTQDVIALGTSNHILQLSNNTTGTKTATLGTNGPMTTTTPNTWIKVRTGAGSTGYIPVWV